MKVVENSILIPFIEGVSPPPEKNWEINNKTVHPERILRH